MFSLKETKKKLNEYGFAGVLVMATVLALGVLAVVLSQSSIFSSLTKTNAATEVQQTFMLNPIADAYVSSANPNRNFNQITLTAGNNNRFITYLKFDLSSLKNKRITSVKLKLRVSEGTTASQDIRQVNGDWDEKKITYRNRPNLGSAVFAFTPSVKDSWTTVDFSQFLSSTNVANLGVVSFGITSNNKDPFSFFSKETSDKPYLEITEMVTVSPAPSATGVPNPESTPIKTPMPSGSPSGNGTAPSGGFGIGGPGGLEVGINLTAFNQVKNDASAGMYDRPCTAAEHDSTKWHSLVNTVAKCHYDHEHGDDPNYVNDIFGEPGTWFGKTGQSISEPWQTFALPASTTAEQALAQTGTPGNMENDLKHQSYFWIVRRGQQCINNEPNGGRDTSTYCIRDFRFLVHGMSLYHEAMTRFHSLYGEIRVCKGNPDATANYDYAKNCGIIRKGGWGDTGMLFTPSQVSNSALINCGENQDLMQSNLIYLDNELQFDPLNAPSSADRFNNSPPGVDSRFRCHFDVRNFVSQLPNGFTRPSDKPAAEWWYRDPFRFHAQTYDPISPIYETAKGNKQIAVAFNCEAESYTDSTGATKYRAKDANCRYNQSMTSGVVEYVLPIPEAITTQDGAFNRLDEDGDGWTDMSPANGRTFYTDRFGDPKSASQCKNGASLDCIPFIYQHVYLGDPGTKEAAYHHIQCETCQRVDHDITPAGQRSWIDWFYNYKM